MTPAAPWESHPAVAHRKEKVRFLQIQDFPLGPSPLLCAAAHLAPLSHAGIRKQRGNTAQAARRPVPMLGLVRGCHVLPDERAAPAPAPRCRRCPHGASLRSCPQERAALAQSKHGRAESPAWEISKETAFCKPHFHLTSLNIFQFQNTHLKITYRNIYMNTEKELSSFGDSAYSPQQNPQLPSCSVTLCLLFSFLFWECLSLFFLKLSCFTPPCLVDAEGFASARSRVILPDSFSHTTITALSMV